jgi:hypothetical protein
LLRDGGLEVEPGDEWSRHDLHLRVHPGFTARLESVVEHQTLVRFRTKVGTPLPLIAVQAGLLGLTLAAATTPATWPMLVPLGALLYALHQEKQRMSATLAAVGRRAGQILGMVPLSKEIATPVPERQGRGKVANWLVAGAKGGETSSAPLSTGVLQEEEA